MEIDNNLQYLFNLKSIICMAKVYNRIIRRYINIKLNDQRYQ